jgi:hypothetical protein
MTPPFLVRLDVCWRDGRLCAVSGDMPGLHVRGDTEAALREKVVTTIKSLWRFDHKTDVEVDPTDDSLVFRVVRIR